MAAKPPTPRGVIAASLPPAIITSASPRWMSRNESPTAWALVVQAVQVAEFGPLAPVRMETQPEARFTIAEGMKNGLTLRGPPFRSASCSRSMVAKPADAAADVHAHLLRVRGVHHEPGILDREVGGGHRELDEPVHLLDFLLLHPAQRGRTPSPRTRTASECWEASKRVMGAAPDWPARRAFHVSSVPMPSGDTSPTPVTTTLRLSDTCASPCLGREAYFLALSACFSM